MVTTRGRNTITACQGEDGWSTNRAKGEKGGLISQDGLIHSVWSIMGKSDGDNGREG